MNEFSWIVIAGGLVVCVYSSMRHVLTDARRARFWLLVAARCRANGEAALLRMTRTRELACEGDGVIERRVVETARITRTAEPVWDYGVGVRQ